MSAPDKSAIERQLDQGWDDIRGLVDSLSDRELLEPGVVEQWSVKDLLGHMAFWAAKAAHDLDLARAGRVAEIEVPGGEEQVAEWNARESKSREDKSLDETRNEWISSFEAAKKALGATAAEVLDLEVAGWDMLTRFDEDTYRHYREHAEQIRAWQRETETTEA